MAVADVPVVDTMGRPVRDLRISVTDRCQFRCTYCMPREVFGRDFAFLPRDQLLTFEELARLARIFAGLGVRKLRLTGGEPLLRRDLETLVAMLAGIGGIADIALTTNGALLAGKAMALAAADSGLAGTNLQVTKQSTASCRAVTAKFPVARVLDTITAAAEAGLAPVKVNMVVRRGVNEQSILPMAAHFRRSGHVLRFIEYMDVGTTNGWPLDEVVPAAEIISLIGGQWPIEPVAAAYPGGGRHPLPVPGRRRGDRRDRLGHPAVLPRLHQGPAVRRRPAVHLPVRRRRARPARPAPRRRQRPGTARADRRHLGPPGRPLLRAAHPPHPAAAGEAEDGDVAHRRLASRPASRPSPPPQARGAHMQ